MKVGDTKPVGLELDRGSGPSCVLESQDSHQRCRAGLLPEYQAWAIRTRPPQGHEGAWGHSVCRDAWGHRWKMALLCPHSLVPPPHKLGCSCSLASCWAHPVQHPQLLPFTWSRSPSAWSPPSGLGHWVPPAHTTQGTAMPPAAHGRKNPGDVRRSTGLLVPHL